MILWESNDCYCSPPLFFIMELKLISSIPPSVNHYLGRSTGKTFKTQEAREYQKLFEEYVRSEVRNQKWITSLDKYQHYYVDMIFYFDRIDKDPSNYTKCMFDAITNTGLVWVDDNVACERINRIFYDKENPRIELTISPVKYIGIFDNSNSMGNFTENFCANCKRKNCKYFKSAKEGRIQSGITQFNCDYIKN